MVMDSISAVLLRAICTCPACGKSFSGNDDPRSGPCGVCRAALSPVPSGVCHSCGIPLLAEGELCLSCRNIPSEEREFHRGICLYGPGASVLLFSYKESGWFRTGKFLGSLLSRNSWLDANAGGSILCPVPSLPSVIRKRGFRHLDLMARNLPLHLRGAWIDLLVRRGGNVQKRLDREARIMNLSGHLQLRKDWRVRIAKAGMESPGPVILIDDIRTTGASLRTARGVLAAAGFGPVRSLSVFLD